MNMCVYRLIAMPLFHAYQLWDATKVIFARILYFCTVCLKISKVKYFHDFCELMIITKKIYHKIFLTAAQSTGLDTSKL